MDGMGDGCRLGAEVILTEEGSMSVSAVDRSPVDKGSSAVAAQTFTSCTAARLTLLSNSRLK